MTSVSVDSDMQNFYCLLFLEENFFSLAKFRLLLYVIWKLTALSPTLGNKGFKEHTTDN